MIRAGQVAIQARETLEHRIKPDGSIVTSADDLVEEYLRHDLEALMPGMGFWGEESGFAEATPRGLWLADPVDGTSNFSYGSPLWGISVALIEAGQITLGAVNLPELGELYLCARGQGVTLNGRLLPRIPPGEIKRNHLVSYCEQVVKAANGQPLPGKMRCAGAVVMDGVYTASQKYRALIGIREKLYDIAAIVLMGEELEADVRYADGSPMALEELMADQKIGRPWVIAPRGCGFTLV